MDDEKSARSQRRVRLEKEDALGFRPLQTEIVTADGVEADVVMRVDPRLGADVRVGDWILERRENEDGSVELRVSTAPLHFGPLNFLHIDEDVRESDGDDVGDGPNYRQILRLKKCDVVQVFAEDDAWIHVRRIDDLSDSGLLRKTTKTRLAALEPPLDCRVVVLIGARGVGRRTIKHRLISERPNLLASVVPMTSRPPEASELEGREYRFVTRRKMLEDIQDGKLVEWGELDGQLYGTSLDDIRRVNLSGRVAVFDAASIGALLRISAIEFSPLIFLLEPSIECKEENADRPEAEHQLCAAEIRDRRRKEHRRLEEQIRELGLEKKSKGEPKIHRISSENRDVAVRRIFDALSARLYATGDGSQEENHSTSSATKFPKYLLPAVRVDRSRKMEMH